MLTRLKSLAIDLTPLRTSRDFRIIMVSGLITFLGSMVTYVVLPFQVKEITGSYVAVGLLGAIEIVPLVIFGLYGGTLADAIDRKKMIVLMEVASLVLTTILLINSLLPHPKLWVLYVVAGIFAAVDGLARPSLDAMIPRILPHDQMMAASALRSVRWQFGAVLGPVIGGILITWKGVNAGYIFDVVTYAVSILLLIRLAPSPAEHDSPAPSLSSLMEGVRYAMSRKDLMGTYAVDLAAMFLAMPMALFPFFADELQAPWALGLLYSSMMIGSVLATFTSGWTKKIHRHGRAILIAAIFWGASISLAGATSFLPLVFFGLILAGGADQISGIFRSTVWNQTIPVELRGRLAGIELLSYSLGPLGGQARAGVMAQFSGLRTSIVGGGILCIGAVAALGAALPTFRKYDDRTNEFALAERKKRAHTPEPE
ncbi:MAG: MFS transporter [Actinobacteria bacterium]|nr:MAG: MFS transporter [Actinomycetota bacterium]